MSKVILAKFETTKDGPGWICQIEGCQHSTIFMISAVHHQYFEHHIPMTEIKFNDADTITWEKK